MAQLTQPRAYFAPHSIRSSISPWAKSSDLWVGEINHIIDSIKGDFCSIYELFCWPHLDTQLKKSPQVQRDPVRLGMGRQAGRVRLEGRCCESAHTKRRRAKPLPELNSATINNSCLLLPHSIPPSLLPPSLLQQDRKCVHPSPNKCAGNSARGTQLLRPVYGHIDANLIS